MADSVSPAPLPLDDLASPAAPTTQAAPSAARGGGARGCAYLLAGCFGTLVLIVGVLAAALFATGATLNNFIAGVGDLFRGEGRAPDLRGFTVPDVEPFTMLSALTTLSYNYSGAVGVATDMPGALQALYGTSQVLIAVGSVEAGVDLSRLTADSLAYDEATRTLTITLPGATITNCYLNEQQTFVAQRTSGPMAPDNTQLETQARRIAIAQFLAQAQESDLLGEAQTRAETLVRQFGQALVSQVGQAVTVEVVSAPPDRETLPPTCRG
jgi:hypothetical protein